MVQHCGDEALLKETSLLLDAWKARLGAVFWSYYIPKTVVQTKTYS